MIDNIPEYKPNYILRTEQEESSEVGEIKKEDPFDMSIYDKEQNDRKDFIARSKSLINRYYQEVITRDRLSSLTENDLFT